MHEIRLEGCRATPLAGYLKGLAVLRLVAEQGDPKAKGAWKGDVLHLYSSLSEEELVDFFMERYAPTPIVAPWNGGSGFTAGDPSEGIDAITNSTDERFVAYRSVIEQIQKWPEMRQPFETVGDVVDALQVTVAKTAPGKKRTDWEALLSSEAAARQALAEELPEQAVLSTRLVELESASKKSSGAARQLAAAWWKAAKKIRTSCATLERSDGKEALLTACRTRLPEDCLSWLDAAFAIRVDGTPSYSPLLGTGGNDGKLDFANNFMQRITTLLLGGESDKSRELLRASVQTVPVKGLSKAKIGQFDPGRAGGFNQGTEVETKDFKINAWDFVLMLEGACVLGGSVCKRSAAGAGGYAAIPFTVSFSGVGFSSSEQSESGRAESWLPLWGNPTGYGEVRHLFGEGRCSIGRRSARSGLDFSRAVGSLGVARGIDEFVRYAFVERRGKSYVALPAGRMPVSFKPALSSLVDVDRILDRADGFLRAFPTMPAKFESVRRRIDEAIHEVSLDPTHERFAILVRGLGRMEYLIAQRSRSKSPSLNRPLHGLRPEWVLKCDDGGTEVRIAAALASIRSAGRVGPIRSNLAGVDAARPSAWAAGSGQQHWYGNTLPDRLSGVLAKRMMDADRLSAPSTPVQAAVELSMADVIPFLYGETDDQRIEELLWGFSLVDWSQQVGLKSLREEWAEGIPSGPAPRGWCLLKLLHQPHKIRGEEVRREPRIQALLAAGRAGEAVALAHRRLRSEGLDPLPVCDGQWVDPQRQRAALLVPVRDSWQLEALVLNERDRTKPNKEMV